MSDACRSPLIFPDSYDSGTCLGQRLVVFSADQLVILGLTYFFLMGALAPLIGWLINKRWPKGIFKYVK